jgi:hypothetical protein
MALRFAKHGKPGDGPGPRFAGENVIYRASGITVLGCVLLAALSNLLPASVKAHWPWLFIFEAAAVFAFGVSWFVKGRTIQGIRARIQKTRRRGTANAPDPGTLLRVAPGRSGVEGGGDQPCPIARRRPPRIP